MPRVNIFGLLSEQCDMYCNWNETYSIYAEYWWLFLLSFDALSVSNDYYCLEIADHRIQKYGSVAKYLWPNVINILLSGREGGDSDSQRSAQTVGRPFAVPCTDFAKSLTDYPWLGLGPWTLLSQMSHHFLFFSSAVFLHASKCQTSDSLIFLHLKSIVICDGSKWWYSRKCLSAWLIMW